MTPLRIAAALAIAALGVALALQIHPYQLDDAYIAYRYAARLAEGGGFAYNPGGPVTEGFSSPLWILSLAAFAKLFGADALPTCGFGLGLAAFALALLLTWRIASAARGDFGGLLSLALVALCPAVAYYAVTGLETVLFLAVVLAFAGSAAGRLPPRLGLAAGIAALWVRPEGGWLPVMLAVQLVGAGRARDLRSGPALALVAAVVAGGAALVATRLALFGEILPNTFYAKPAELGYGAAYTFLWLMVPWAGGTALLGLLGGLAGGAPSRGYLAGALSWVAASAIEGGDWMPQARMLVPALGLFAAAAGGLTTAFGAGARRLRVRERRTFAVAAAMAVVAVLGYDVRATLRQAEEGYSAMRGLHRDARLLVRWLDAAGVRSLGLVDIGVIGFRTGLEIVDFAGLVDPRVARAPGPHLGKEFDLAYLFETRRPDAIVLRVTAPREPPAPGSAPRFGPEDGFAPIESRILGDPRFDRAYRLHHAILPGYSRKPYYGLLVYTRRDFSPPPEVSRLLPPPDRSGAVTVYVLPAKGSVRAP